MSAGFEKTALRVSPMGDKIMMVRFGPNETVALDRKNITHEFWDCLIKYSFFGEFPGVGESIDVEIEAGQAKFTMNISRYE